MDFLRTLKKRKPKKHASAAEDRAKPRGIRGKKLSATLNLASFLALILGLTVTQGQADDYYIYKIAKGELVISSKQPPPGSTIIRQLLGETTPAQESDKPLPNVKPEDSPKPTKSKCRRQPELTLRALSYGLVALLGITLLVLSLISISKENRRDEPISGMIWFSLAMIGFCAVIVLLPGYVQKAKSSEKGSHPQRNEA